MSLALYSFDGSVRRDKASEALVDDLKSRERFLAKINQERDERAQITKRQSAAVKIQSYYRSFAARKGVKAELRLAFDRVCAGSKNNKVDVKTLNEQIARLILFHSPATDQQRLVR
uniref:Uncharacterized protein n=1 Tax=Plectus sambesii TaxID=2011161 RepID=A0A914V4Q4_9BILA